MKKIIILLGLLVAAVAAMTYIYFSKLDAERNAQDLALQSATNNAALIFAFRNDKSFYEIMSGQDLLQQVLGKDKNMLLQQFKQSIVDNRLFNDFINDQQIYLSLLPDSNKQLNFLITLQIRQDKTIKQFYEKLKGKITEYPNQKDIYKIQLNDSLSVFAGVQNQVITTSTSLKLIQDAGIRLKENPFTEYIKQSSRLNKNILASLYVNYNQAPPLLKNVLSSNINGELNLFNGQNSYAALTYNFSKEKILFNGNTELKDSQNYLNLFENISPQNITINSVLPENTANYTLYAFDVYSSWLSKLNDLHGRLQTRAKAEANILKIQKEYRTDLNKVFIPFVKNQFVLLQLNTGEKLGVVLLSNGEKVKQLLLDVSNDYDADIKVFKPADILYAYFGEPFKKFARPYYTIIDNNLVVANNASTLRSFLNSYKNNRLLTQNLSYMDALNQISGTSNVNYYINFKNSADLFRTHVAAPFYKHLKADSGLKNFDALFYQMGADKQKFTTNFLLSKPFKPSLPDTLNNP